MKRTVRPEQEVEASLQGTDIVEAILDNSQQGQFEFPERVIVPAVYHIYLHPEDLDRLKPVEAIILEECKESLNQRLRNLNRKRFGRKSVQYGIQAQDWEIKLLADYHEGAAPGSVKVVSSLASAEESDLVGTVTVRVKRSPRATPSASPVPAPEMKDPRVTKDSRETRKAPVQLAPETSLVWGTLSWRDDEGDKTFEVGSAAVSIGRGSQMDVIIRNGSEAVSRKHCTIRLDPTGKAWICDPGSSNGTMLDGVVLVPNTEIALPDASRISLANGVVTMNFTRRSD
ncbi:MAG TPA: FHA domain-containing protein [Bryobacteraceae bacterium]